MMHTRIRFIPLLLSLIALIGTGTALADDSCFHCHDKSKFVGQITHSPTRKGQCTQCHNPHLARYDRLLKKNGRQLCFQCHETFEQTVFSAPRVHQPVVDGACTVCHDPHSSQTSGLLKRPLADLCSSCHSEVLEQPGTAHAPFAKGQCTVCHQPHSGNDRALLIKTGSALCLSCHPSTAPLRKIHLNRALDGMDCLECHHPHKSQQQALLRDNRHQPFAKGQCQSCHARNNDTSLCLTCHPKVLATFNGQFSHRVNGEQANSCFNCHTPHASRQAGLIKQAPGQACRQCHESKFVRRRQSLHRHPQADQCVNCHQLHSSDLPAMRINDDDSACLKCHESHSNFSHPMGNDALDPRNGQPMNCISCHDPCNGTMYRYNLRGTSDKGLCIMCHAGY